MSESTYYYADANKKPVGPYSLGQLQELATRGVIKPTTKAIRKGDRKWVPYSQLATASPTSPTPAGLLGMQGNHHVNYYYILKKEKWAQGSEGPYSEEVLRRYWEEGKIPAGTLCRTKENPPIEWIPIEAFLLNETETDPWGRVLRSGRFEYNPELEAEAGTESHTDRMVYAVNEVDRQNGGRNMKSWTTWWIVLFSFLFCLYQHIKVDARAREKWAENGNYILRYQDAQDSEIIRRGSGFGADRAAERREFKDYAEAFEVYKKLEDKASLYGLFAWIFLIGAVVLFFLVL